jgi:threonine dehydratase
MDLLNMCKPIITVLDKIKPFIKKTPLDFHQRLSKLHNCSVYLKREDLQYTRSFKVRGAANKIISLSTKEQQHGVCCVSQGNHSQGVSYICDKLNISCYVFMPTNTPVQKINKLKDFNNTHLVLYGSTFDECLTYGLKYSKDNNLTFIHPYDDIDIIQGQSTVTQEIIDELPNTDIIIYSVGGGGLISGACVYKKMNNLKFEIIGIEPESCPSLTQTLKNKQNTRITEYSTFVDGATVPYMGELTSDICINSDVKCFNVQDGKICVDLIDMYQIDGIITEPAGVLSVSGLDYIENLEGKNVVCVISGGNNDLSRYPLFLEKAQIFKNIRFYFIVKFAQVAGELKRFILNVLQENDDIIRFEYLKKNNTSYGNVLICIETFNFDQLISNMNKHHFKFEITNSNLFYS